MKKKTTKFPKKMNVYFVCNCRMAGAWRLAQTNVNRTHDYLLGFPMAIAGINIALLAFFSFVSPLIMIGLSILMISPIEIPKF